MIDSHGMTHSGTGVIIENSKGEPPATDSKPWNVSSISHSHRTKAIKRAFSYRRIRTSSASVASQSPLCTATSTSSKSSPSSVAGRILTWLGRIFRAGERGKISTYIVCPPTIYGAALNNPGNKTSIQLPSLIKASIAHKTTVQYGKGENVWSGVRAFYLLSSLDSSADPPNDLIGPCARLGRLLRSPSPKRCQDHRRSRPMAALLLCSRRGLQVG